MIVDKESFTDLAVRLKLVSDGILQAARSMAMLSNNAAPGEHTDHLWAGAIVGLEHSLAAVMHMEQLMSALLEAQDLVTPTPRVGTA